MLFGDSPQAHFHLNLYYAVNLEGILNISYKIHEGEKEPAFISNNLRGQGACPKPSSVQG